MSAPASGRYHKIAAAALANAGAVLEHWLPGGEWSGDEYKPLNPTRDDSSPGSFSINTKTGVWADFAMDDDKGGDLVSLVAYVDGCTPREAVIKLTDFLASYSENGVTRVTRVTPKHSGKEISKLSDSEGVTRPKSRQRDTRDTVPPNDAPAPDFTHPRHGKPVKVWLYHTANGLSWFYVCRFDIGDNVKEFAPRTFNGKTWRWKALPTPWPLYNLHILTDRPDAPVLVTEGEKAAAAAAALFPDCVTTTTPGGAKAPGKCDLSPLNGRRVLIWPDNDETGMGYAEKIASMAHQAGAASVAILNLDKLPGAPLPYKGDAADVSLTRKQAKKLLNDAGSWREVKEKLVVPQGFTLKGDGVYYLDTVKNGNTRSVWMCSPLHITAKTRDADSNTWGVLLEFPDADGRQHRWAMPLELLAGDGNDYRRALLSQGLQIAPTPKARQRLSEYLQAAPVTARARCVTKTGWHNGVFVLPDETLGEDDERVLLQSLHVPAAMRTGGTLEGWLHGVAALCIGNSRLTLVVSAAFAAPLLDITGDDSGGIHLQGLSSNGKTTALHAAVSVWGGPDYLQRWRATSNGLEAAALTHNDALLCLDELAQVDAREAGEVAYMLANGTGKQRARQDGLAKPKASWRVLFLSAGEIGLAQHMLEGGKKARAGQEVRLADIPADAGAGHGIFENLHGYSDGAAFADAIRAAARTHHGHAARAYLRALVALNPEELRSRLRSLCSGFTREALPANADGQVVRVCDRFALIAAAGELATGMGLTGWASGAATQAARRCFQAWVDHRGGAGAQEERQALAQVERFFELHSESRFSNLDNSDDVRTINRAGFRRTTNNGVEYFVLPQVWRTEVCEGINPTYTARLCVEHGLIKPDSEGKPTSVHRLGNTRRLRCYHFILTAVAMGQEAPANTRQCESNTATASRCKHMAQVYHRHTDGEDYAACAQHQKSFNPCAEVTGQTVSRASPKF